MDKQAKKEMAIAASLSAIPYIGGSVASIYTSIKTNKEFERIDSFFEDISKTIQRFDERLTNALKENNHDDEYLGMLLENTIRKVEKEAREGKRNAFKCFFTNALISGVNPNTYDHANFYLESLDSLNNTDIQVLLLINKANDLVLISDINSNPPSDPYFILASINKIRSFGFIEVYTGELHVGAKDNALNERVKLSQLGKDFISFCLS